MFAIPLNVRHRHLNASGRERALLASVTNLPLMQKLWHNDGFIFDNEYFFADRFGKDTYYQGEGDLTMVRAGYNIWETNFVPDLSAIELTEWTDRGAGSLNLRFMLADGNMHAHISEIQSGTYKKAHRHGPGAHIFNVTGTGYSLLWVEGEKDSNAWTGVRAGSSRRSTASFTSTSRPARLPHAIWRSFRAATPATRSSSRRRVRPPRKTACATRCRSA